LKKKSKEINQWIEATLKEELPKANLRESLLDGVVLCKLVNAICPGALKRYHKKPRMLAMKIENIGFFLATCKTRLNLPPALLFQPTDIHDDSNNLASMSKVLNVLSFLKGDGDGGMITGLEDDEEEEVPEPHHKVEEPDPEIEPPEPTHDVPPITMTSVDNTHVTPKVVPSVPVKMPSPRPSSDLHASAENFGEMQTEVLKVINEAINQELSIESKRKLVKILQQQLTSFEEKLMITTDDQLAAQLREISPEEAQKSHSRKATVEALNIYSRVQ